MVMQHKACVWNGGVRRQECISKLITTLLVVRILREVWPCLLNSLWQQLWSGLTLKRVRGKKPLKHTALRRVLGLLWNACFSWFYLLLWQRTVQGVAESRDTPAPAEVFGSDSQYFVMVNRRDTFPWTCGGTKWWCPGADGRKKRVSLPWGLFNRRVLGLVLVCMLVVFFPKNL